VYVTNGIDSLAMDSILVGNKRNDGIMFHFDKVFATNTT